MVCPMKDQTKPVEVATEYPYESLVPSLELDPLQRLQHLPVRRSPRSPRPLLQGAAQEIQSAPTFAHLPDGAVAPAGTTTSQRGVRFGDRRQRRPGTRAGEATARRWPLHCPLTGPPAPRRGGSSGRRVLLHPGRRHQRGGSLHRF